MIFLLVVMVFFEFDFVFIVVVRQGCSMDPWLATTHYIHHTGR